NAVNLLGAVALVAMVGFVAATALMGGAAADGVAEWVGTGAGTRDGPRPYAAILMDANMPVMDGFASSREIIATHGASAPPIIALTASVLEEDRQRCLAAGMVGFLPKPLRIDELSEALARYARQADGEGATKIIAKSQGAAWANPQNDPQTPVILMDWSRLEQFKEFDDDERTMTREVIALFTSDAPNRINDIREALEASDSAELSRAAHALKGAASNVGAEALSDACFVLEQSCLQGQWPADAAQQVARVCELADRTRQALNDWMAA
ncbi:MAG: Hpt domain-containing protein, partial [Polaromonas sp.]|nr:Hpt domain-containing protein [Polaromonas sp.]